MYISGGSAMSGRRYSVAEARQRFTELVRTVETGRPLEITRRGRPVAVLVAAAEYARLAGSEASFGAALHAFRESTDPKLLRGRDPFARARDRSPGRDVDV
jgi:prevent-host-death family protein